MRSIVRRDQVPAVPRVVEVIGGATGCCVERELLSRGHPRRVIRGAVQIHTGECRCSRLDDAVVSLAIDLDLGVSTQDSDDIVAAMGCRWEDRVATPASASQAHVAQASGPFCVHRDDSPDSNPALRAHEEGLCPRRPSAVAP